LRRLSSGLCPREKPEVIGRKREVSFFSGLAFWGGQTDFSLLFLKGPNFFPRPAKNKGAGFKGGYDQSFGQKI
jgi:hypothetical protein